MNLYRRNGITDLASMRENYDIFSSQENTDQYLQNEHSPWFAGGGDKENTTTLTDNTGKSWYENTLNYLFGGTRGLIESEYKPTRGDKGEKYYTRKGLKNDVVLNLLGGIDAGALNKNGTPKYYSSLNDAYEHLSKLNNRGFSASRTAGNATLGEYGVSAGSDSRGKYISFSDKFDYRILPMIFGNSLHPYQLYDRIYEDEWDNLSKLQANGDPNSGNIFLRPGGGGAGGSIYTGGGNKKRIIIKASGGPKEEFSMFPVSTQEDNPANIGLTNMKHDITKGDIALYGELGKDYQYFRKNDTGQIFGIGPYEAERIGFNPEDKYIKDNFTKVSYPEIKELLPKRDYIGGENYRINTVKKVPGLLDFIKDRATAYGINPNLLLHRFLKEGWVDNRVREYNESIDTADQKDYFSKVANDSVSGFGDMGLDDAGTNLLEGKYALKNPNVTWESVNDTNEKGRDVTSIWTENLWDALEIKAAEMAYRQRELAKRGITGDAYVNAAYNLGLNHKDLNNKDYIEKTYSVPTYYSSGGPIHIKPSRRGTFTAAATKHGMGVQEFASHVLANKIKKAVFAKNFGKKSYGGVKF